MTTPVDISSLAEHLDALSSIAGKEFTFVLGMPKSGTTWVQNLLNAHQEIICRGETNTQQRWLEPLSECVSKYNEHARANGFDKVFYTEQQHDLLFLSGYLMVMKQWLADRNSSSIRVLAERTPNRMAERIQCWNRYFPESKFVHIIRDPRDAAVSGWLFWTRRLSDQMSQRYSGIEEFFTEYVGAWVNQMNKCEQAIDPIRDRYFTISYEELCENASPILKNAFAFLEVANSEGDIQHCIDQASFEKMAGRSTGEEDFTGSKYRKGVAGDWVNHIDPDWVNQHFGDVFEQFGYGRI
jgi:hypothetical protein